MQKINNFFDNNRIIICIIIISILGFLFRLSTGLMELRNDEIATLRTAMQTFPFGILEADASKNLHAPLYYFILHFWIKLFGSNTFILRLLPILLGTLCIPVSYLCAKELSQPKINVLVALLVAINPFLIAFSNFGKFYSFLSLLSFLSILFLLKIKKDTKSLNIVFLAVVNALIVYTFVLGFLFVLIQFVFFTCYLIMKKDKNGLRNWLLQYPLALCLLILPVVNFIALIIGRTQSGLFPTFWWYTFDIKDITGVIFSWFSPALPAFYMKGIATEPTQAFFVSNKFYLIIFNLIPLCIASFGIYKALMKKNFVSLLFYVSLLFIIAELVGAVLGRFAFCPRYTVLAFPSIILATAYGLSLIESADISFGLVLTFFFINIFFKNIGPENIYVAGPSEIHSIANVLEMYSPTKNDFVIMPYRGYYLEAFYDTKVTNFISFDINYAYKINDKNVLKNILDEKYTKSEKTNPYERFRAYISAKNPQKQISEYLQRVCFSKLKKNSKVYLVLYKPEGAPSIEQVLGDEKVYKSQPILNLLSLKINQDLQEITSRNLRLEAVEKSTNFNIYIYGIR